MHGYIHTHTYVYLTTYIYMYAYILTDLWVYLYMNICKHTCIHSLMFGYIDTDKYTWRLMHDWYRETFMLVCLHTYIQMYIHSTQRHLCMSVYIYTYMFASKYACIHPCMSGYTHRHIFLHPCIYKHKYAYTFMHVFLHRNIYMNTTHMYTYTNKLVELY